MSGFFALCKHIGAPLGTYLEPDNPAQQLILALCSRVIDEPLPPERIAVDGCGIPVFATSLRRAARAFARFAALEELDDEDREALKRCRTAMADNPWYVSGTGRFDTALIESTRGAVIGKGGAEGFHGSAIMRARRRPCDQSRRRQQSRNRSDRDGRAHQTRRADVGGNRFARPFHTAAGAQCRRTNRRNDRREPLDQSPMPFPLEHLRVDFIDVLERVDLIG